MKEKYIKPQLKLDEFKVLERDLSKLTNILAPFPRLHYSEAAAMVKKENAEFNIGDDFGAPDETIISSRFDRPVFVHQGLHSLRDELCQGAQSAAQGIVPLRHDFKCPDGCCDRTDGP